MPVLAEQERHLANVKRIVHHEARQDGVTGMPLRFPIPDASERHVQLIG